MKDYRWELNKALNAIKRSFPDMVVMGISRQSPPRSPLAGPGGAVQGPKAPNHILDYMRSSARCIVETSENGLRIHQLPKTTAKNKPPCGHSTEIFGSSDSSLRRAKRKLERIDYGLFSSGKYVYKKRGFFFSLTWHKKNPSRCGKAELRAFQMRLKRRFRRISIFWRLEWQERGSPHYHMIICVPEPVALGYMEEWVWKNWIDIIGEPTACAQDVIGIFGRGVRLIQYLVGYAAKQDVKTPDIPTGRTWGFVGEPFPQILRRCCEIKYSEFRLFIRRVRRWSRGKSFYLERARPEIRGFLFFR